MATSTDTPPDAPRPTSPRPDLFGPGPGFAIAGAGLLALAAVEAAKLTAPSEPGADRTVIAAPAPDLGSLQRLAQSAVGTGPGSPRPRGDGAPPASGQLVGLASNPIPNGTALYRLWSSGRVEAMITTEDGVWGEWVVVAPGTSTDMRRPRPPEDPENPD